MSTTKNTYNHKGVVIDKPWGYEYLVYENQHVALWLLHIAQGQQTSMHCHPTKTTGLVLVQGEAELSFLADKKKHQGTRETGNKARAFPLDEGAVTRWNFHVRD